MSPWKRLAQIRADWDRWADRLSIAVAVFFAAAIVLNIGLFFSARKTPSLPGAAFSWLYLISWSLAAIVLRNRTRWVRAARAVRWAAVAAILLGLAAGASGGMGFLSALCVMPYAVFTSVYSGLSLGAWVNYVLPLVQAATVSLLSRRLRRRKQDPNGGSRSDL